MAKRERHTTRAADAKLELRSVDGESLPEIVGYSAVYNVFSDDLGGFRERLLPGTFDRTLGERPDSIKAFHNHDQNIVIGSTRKGTLELHSDEHGLSHRIQPPDNEWGRPVVDAIERGDVEGMSFGFSLPNASAAEWGEHPENGERIRDVREAKLFEVSTVSGWPAYPQTSVGVRALATALGRDADELDADLATADPETMAEIADLLTTRFAPRDAVETLAATVARESNLARMARFGSKLGLSVESPPTESPGIAPDAPTEGTAHIDNPNTAEEA